MPASTSRLLPAFALSLWVLSGTAGSETADSAGADHIVSPESIDHVITVNAEELIEKVMTVPELVLIDSRIPADRNEGYIEGSISLPDIETDCDSLAKVVTSVQTPVMFYCNGIRCGRSARAAVIARDCGYQHIYWFRTGMEEWQEKEFPLVQ